MFKKELIVFILVIFIISFVNLRASLSNPHIYSLLTAGETGQGTLGELILNTGGAVYGLIVPSGRVGFGEDFPKATLDVVNQRNGFLPPRLTTSERNAISLLEPGLMVFNTDQKRFNFFDGSGWKEVEDSENTSPQGAIVYFDLPTCPPGWSEATEVKGKSLVGFSPGGTLGLSSSVGQALSNMENRATGQHNHSSSQDPHQHSSYYEYMRIQTGNWVENARCCCSWFGWTGSWTDTDSRQPAVNVDNAGSVPGTNAPYIQFLACKKN